MDETTFIPTGMYAQPPDRNAAWEAVAADLGTDLQYLNAGRVATIGAVERGFGGDSALTWYAADGAVVRETYAELAEQSARAAGLFANAGLQAGDRVLFILPTVPELIHGTLGALRMGGLVATFPPTRNADTLRQVLELCRPKFVVTLPSYKTILATHRTPEIAGVFYVNRTSFTLPAMADYEAAWTEAFTAATPQAEGPRTNAGDGALINCLDGGTGGSLLSHESALGLAMTARASLGWTPREPAVLALVPGEPAFAPYFLLAPFLAGVHLVCHEDPARFNRHADVAAESSPKAWFSSFKALDVMIRTDPNLGTLLKGCTSIAVLHPADPSFLIMSSLSWGAPVKTAWLPWEIGVIQSCGGEDTPGSAGVAVQGADIHIVDESGREVVADTPGTIALRLGPSAPFLGYWQDPETTAARMRDGWFYSPERGRIDPAGNLWIAT